MLTDNEIRIAIARAKGWKFYQWGVVSPTGFMLCLPEEIINPGAMLDKFPEIVPPDIFDKSAKYDSAVPDWPTDIAAAWELEESIPEDQRENYIDALFEITKVDDSTMYWDGVSWATYDGLWAFIHATPRTRCLAWLKWKGVEVE